MSGAQTKPVKNCILLVVENSNGKFFMKIEKSTQYQSEIVKFLSHKKVCDKVFTQEDEQKLLKETVGLYFKNQVSTDRFEKINILSIENNVFHVYKAILKKHVNVIGSRIHLIDRKKLKGKNFIEVCNTPCLVTDSTKDIISMYN